MLFADLYPSVYTINFQIYVLKTIMGTTLHSREIVSSLSRGDVESLLSPSVTFLGKLKSTFLQQRVGKGIARVTPASRVMGMGTVRSWAGDVYGGDVKKIRRSPTILWQQDFCKPNFAKFCHIGDVRFIL